MNSPPPGPRNYSSFSCRPVLPCLVGGVGPAGAVGIEYGRREAPGGARGCPLLLAPGFPRGRARGSSLEGSDFPRTRGSDLSDFPVHITEKSRSLQYHLTIEHENSRSLQHHLTIEHDNRSTDCSSSSLRQVGVETAAKCELAKVWKAPVEDGRGLTCRRPDGCRCRLLRGSGRRRRVASHRAAWLRAARAALCAPPTTSS